LLLPQWACRAGEEDASAAQQLLRNCACELQLLVVECQIELEESQKDMGEGSLEGDKGPAPVHCSDSAGLAAIEVPP
jgi:hypothetical protein